MTAARVYLSSRKAMEEASLKVSFTLSPNHRYAVLAAAISGLAGPLPACMDEREDEEREGSSCPADGGRKDFSL